MAEEVLTIGAAVLLNWYRKYMGEEPPEWFRTAGGALGRTYNWVKDCAERHEQLHKVFTSIWVVFSFLLSPSSRKIFLGFLASIWAVFSFLLGSVWLAFSFLVGSLWGGISFVITSYVFVVAFIWAKLCFLVGSIWMALCFIAGSIWVALCFIAALVWAALPFLLVSGLVVYGGFLIWGKYQTRLELYLTTLKTNPNPKGPLIRIDVTRGNTCYELIVPAYSTFGDVKKRFAKRTGLEVGRQRLLFRGNEKRDQEHLHKAGVVDESDVLIM